MPSPNRIVKNPRAADFRYVFSNSYGIQFNNSEAIITFGLTESLNDPQNSIEDQMGIVMSPIAAKTLALVLQGIIAQYEKDNNISVAAHQESVDAVLSGGSSNKPR